MDICNTRQQTSPINKYTYLGENLEPFFFYRQVPEKAAEVIKPQPGFTCMPDFAQMHIVHGNSKCACIIIKLNRVKPKVIID